MADEGPVLTSVDSDMGAWHLVSSRTPDADLHIALIEQLKTLTLLKPSNLSPEAHAY